MRTAKVEDILSRLQELQIARGAIFRQEVGLLNELHTHTSNSERERQQPHREEPEETAARAERTTPLKPRRILGFYVGQHVYINNLIRHVELGKATPAEWAAVVTKITTAPKRVYIETYNGYSTWRDPSNIVRLPAREQVRICNTYGWRWTTTTKNMVWAAHHGFDVSMVYIYIYIYIYEEVGT